MSTNVYDVGDLLPVQSPTFLNASGTPTNPSTVTFEYTKPDGTEHATTYGGTTSPTVNRPSTGNYALDLTIDQAGPWYYRWYSTGTGQTASRGSFDAIDYKPT